MPRYRVEILLPALLLNFLNTMKENISVPFYVKLACLSLSILAFLPIAAQGGFGPSFSLKNSTCKATDIFVATEGDKIDGELRVVDVWKGDLLPNDEVTVPELGFYINDWSRTVTQFGSEFGPPTVADGKWAVLFLIRDENTPLLPDRNTKSLEWLSTGMAMIDSFAWIDHNSTYAIMGGHNPGSMSLIDLKISETEMRGQVRDLLKSGCNIEAKE